MALFVAAGAAVALALTAQLWLPAIPTLFGAVESNRNLIGAFADLATVSTFAILLAGGALAYLGYRNLQTANDGQQAQQSVVVEDEGRGAAVGDVNRGAVVVGDHNRVEIHAGVTYSYSEVEPSAPDPAVLERSRRQLEALPVDDLATRGGLPPRSIMRLRPNPHFVGRREDLKTTAAALKAGGAAAIGEVTVAASGGLGGVGKTQLACEFVHRYGRYFHGVYWLNFGEPAEIPTEVASCGGAEGMNLRPFDYRNLPVQERVRAVMAEWQNDLPRLLVFDNCEDEGLLDRWLPPAGGCRVLVTSRRESWDPSLGVTDLKLGVLERPESVALLREHRPDIPADSPELDVIAEELGDLPLALDLAGRYLRKYRREVTPAAYLEEIGSPDLLEHPSLRQAGGVSPTKHEMDVWRTFAVSYRRLDPDEETGQTASRLLARAARLAAGEPVPDYLLAWTLEPPDGDDAPGPSTTIRDALDRLADLGLLQRSEDEATSMHRLVAVFALAEIPDDGAQAAVETACSDSAKWAISEGQPAWWEALLPHVRLAADSAKRREDALAENCCTQLSAMLFHLGAYDEAMPYAERAWDLCVRLVGPDNQSTLQRRGNLAALHRKMGNLGMAKVICGEVLEAQERTLGARHPDVAASLNNLAIMLKSENLYHEALPLYERALRIRLRVWEMTVPNDPERREHAGGISESYANMGHFLMALGRHRGAVHYLDLALGISIAEVGENHERNAGALVSYGLAMRAQGEYQLAVMSLASASHIYENLGSLTLAQRLEALTVLGTVVKDQADHDSTLSGSEREQVLREAHGCLQAALNEAEQIVGDLAPVIVGGILTALAEVCFAQDFAEDSRHYRERAGACRRENFRVEGAESASRLNNQATSLTIRGLYEEAFIYLERALSIREDLSEEQDFDTSTSLMKLGMLHQLWGRDAQARPYLERALALRAELCGNNHPATEMIRENLHLLQD